MNRPAHLNPLPLEPEQHSIVIIGRGKVGKSLSQLFKLHNFSVSNIGRSKSAQASSVEHATIVFLCIDDGSIENLCIELAPSLPQGCIVSHCSGALDSLILLSARESGCAIASTHPLNTFPNLEDSLSLFSKKTTVVIYTPKVMQSH